jgi:hypothetical protein
MATPPRTLTLTITEIPHGPLNVLAAQQAHEEAMGRDPTVTTSAENLFRLLELTHLASPPTSRPSRPGPVASCPEHGARCGMTRCQLARELSDGEADALARAWSGAPAD